MQSGKERHMYVEGDDRARSRTTWSPHGAYIRVEDEDAVGTRQVDAEPAHLSRETQGPPSTATSIQRLVSNSIAPPPPTHTHPCGSSRPHNQHTHDRTAGPSQTALTFPRSQSSNSFANTN
jgi:hypothetical protein